MPTGLRWRGARYYVGRGGVTSGADGYGHFSILLPVGLGIEGVVSAAATATNRDTSEMGPCVSEDTLFVSGFEL